MNLAENLALIRADYGCVCDDPENFCGGADIDPDEDGYCAACAALDGEAHCLICPFDCCTENIERRVTIVIEHAESARGTWQRVAAYTVSAVPEGLCLDGYAWEVTVEWRGDGLWAVKHHSQVLSSSGKWDYEPQPSSRTDAWKRRHRFTEEEALRLAHKAAPTVCINGSRPADLIAKYEGQP